jgi:hypothetical protein
LSASHARRRMVERAAAAGGIPLAFVSVTE